MTIFDNTKDFANKFFNNLPVNQCNNEDYRSKVLQWFGADREQYHLDAVRFGEPIITYRMNSYGYRGDEFMNAQHRILVCGCSNSFGQAVNEEDMFGHVVKQYLQSKFGGDAVVWNLSSPGKSNDYIARMVDVFTNTWKPTLCLINFTFLQRREFFNKKGQYVHYLRQAKELSWHKDIVDNLDKLSNPFEDLANFYKNYKIIKNCMGAKSIPWLFSNCDEAITDLVEVAHDPTYVEFFKKLDIARDNMHPGPKSHKWLGDMYIKRFEERYGEIYGK